VKEVLEGDEEKTPSVRGDADTSPAGAGEEKELET